MLGFDYVMQNFDRLEQRERNRLEIMLRFTKYSIRELTHLFMVIDVEKEVERILVKRRQYKVGA